MKDFSEWLYEQEIGPNKNNLLAPSLQAQQALDFLRYYLLDEDWYVIDPISMEQANTEIVDSILFKYSKKYRKEIKQLRRKLKMLGKMQSEDKRVKQIILGCECGCEQAINIIKYIEDNDYYITITMGTFYERQRGIIKTIKQRIKASWYMLIGKEYRLCDINIKETEIDKIIESLKEIKNEK